MPPDPPAREREWEKHRTRIWHLLHHKKLRPEKLRDHMRGLGFDATLQEYKVRCKQWGIPRTIQRETTKYITHRIEKRKREKKPSAVVVAGVRWTDKKINQEACRNFYTTQELMMNPNPSTPPGILVTVCSPKPMVVDFSAPSEWPSDLPWLRFNRMLENYPVDILGNMVHRLTGASRGQIAQSLSTLHGQFELQRVATNLGLGFLRDTPNTLELSNHLQRTMPEQYPGEHLVRSQWLTQRAEMAIPEFLRLAFHQLSNNYADYYSCELVRDELLLELATGIGLVELTQAHMDEPTISSILDQVWGAALRRGRYKVVARLLKRRFRVDRPCHCFDNRNHHWPLTVVLNALNRDRGCRCQNRNTTDHPAALSNHECQAVIQVLLAAGASPDVSCCTRHKTPMEMAIQWGWLDLTQSFVEHSIRTHGQDYLLRMDFDSLFLRIPWSLDPGKQQAMLGYLWSSSADRPSSDPYDSFLSPEGLIRAATKGCPPLLRALREMGADFNCHTTNGHFPIGAVLVGPHVDRFSRLKVLVELGASVNYQPVAATGENYPSALHIALCSSFYNMDGVITLLLENGASTHTPALPPVSYPLGPHTSQCLENVKTPLTPLELALWIQNYDGARLLLDFRAPFRGHEACFLFQSLLDLHHHNRLRSQFLPLHLLKAMVSRGATLGLVSGSDKTVLDIAILLENRELVSYLVEIGAPQNTNMSLKVDVDDSTHDWWLDQLRALARGDDFSTDSLDGWLQLHPFSSQDALLDGVASRATPGIYSYLLHRFPQAYSSNAVASVLDLLENPHFDQTPHFKQTLVILHELIKRRRKNKFTDFNDESEVLDKIVHLTLRPRFAELMDIIELVASQDLEMDLPHFGGHPILRLLADLGSELFASLEESGIWKPLLNKIMHAGFRDNTLVGLVAVSDGCSINQLQDLIDSGFDPRKRYHWTHTALQYAVLRQDIEMVRFLLSRGVDVNGRPNWTEPSDKEERDPKYPSYWFDEGLAYGNGTALQQASDTGNFECIELLTQRGADINAPAGRLSGGTALQKAVARGHIGIVKWLIDQGADVLAPGSVEFGATAIEGAAMNGRTDVLGFLLAKANFETGEGRRQCTRAIGYARASGHQLLASYMERHIGWSAADEETLDQESLVDFEEFYDREEEFCSDENCECHGETSVDEGIDGPPCWRNRFESPEARNDYEEGSTTEDSTCFRTSEVDDDDIGDTPHATEMQPVWRTLVGVDPEEGLPSADAGPVAESWEEFVNFDGAENPPSTGFMEWEEFWETLAPPGADSAMVWEVTGDDDMPAFGS